MPSSTPFSQGFAECLEQGSRNGILRSLIFGVPLHGERKAGCAVDANGFGSPIFGAAFYPNSRPGRFNSLPVQRIHRDDLVAEHVNKNASGLECNLVPKRELLIDGSIGRHPMIHPAGQFTNIRMKRPAECDIELLESAANAEHWLSPLHASPNQRESCPIPAPVKCSMGVSRNLAVFFRMNIGTSAGEQNAVANSENLIHRTVFRLSGKDQRHRARNIRDGVGIHGSRPMNRVLPFNKKRVSYNTDYWTRHSAYPACHSTISSLLCHCELSLKRHCSAPLRTSRASASNLTCAG